MVVKTGASGATFTRRLLSGLHSGIGPGNDEMAMFSFTIDDDRGVVRCTVAGQLSMDDAKRLKAESLRHTREMRGRLGRMMMVVDSREAEVQNSEINESFKGFAPGLIESAEDRIALVLGSSFRKVRATELHKSPQVKAFISPNAAEIWLLAYARSAGYQQSA